jgi:cell division protease FtsH
MAMSLPEEDSYSRTRGWLEDRITIMYGGWAAEKLFFNETTTGTKQDIQQASDIARRMVCEWGMASELGPIAYGQEDEPIFLGKEIARHKDYSENTAQCIDREIKKILGACIAQAESILAKEKDRLAKLSDALIARETLIDDEVRELLDLPRKNKPEKTDA